MKDKLPEIAKYFKLDEIKNYDRRDFVNKFKHHPKLRGLGVTSEKLHDYINKKPSS